MALGAEPSADHLMRQVAERFQQASQGRREYVVAPVEDRTEKTLTSFEAQYRKGKQMVTSTDPKDPDLDEGMDRGMLDSLTGHLVDDRKSRRDSAQGVSTDRGRAVPLSIFVTERHRISGTESQAGGV